jgi:HNH endonuclease
MIKFIETRINLGILFIYLYLCIMKIPYFNREEHYNLFRLLYIKYNVSIEDIAIILNSNSFSIRKYLKEWELHDRARAIHKNKLKDGWNKLRKINICQNYSWNGKCDRAHIISKKDGGSYRAENILILCPNCHRMFDRNLLNLNHLIIKQNPK